METAKTLLNTALETVTGEHNAIQPDGFAKPKDIPAQSQKGAVVGLESKMTPLPEFERYETGEIYKAANKLQGKKALITGGDSGIGRAVAVVFAMGS